MRCKFIVACFISAIAPIGFAHDAHTKQGNVKHIDHHDQHQHDQKIDTQHQKAVLHRYVDTARLDRYHSNHYKQGSEVTILGPESSSVNIGETVTQHLKLYGQSGKEVELYISADQALDHDLPEYMKLTLEKGKNTLPVALTANTEGRYYLTVVARINGRSQVFGFGQTFSGDKSFRPKMKVSHPAQGGIKRYKAQETIR